MYQNCSTFKFQNQHLRLYYAEFSRREFSVTFIGHSCQFKLHDFCKNSIRPLKNLRQITYFHYLILHALTWALNWWEARLKKSGIKSLKKNKSKYISRGATRWGSERKGVFGTLLYLLLTIHYQTINLFQSKRRISSENFLFSQSVFSIHVRRVYHSNKWKAFCVAASWSC